MQDQVTSLLSKLRDVIHTGRARPGRPAQELRLIQACADTTVDAVELLLARTRLDGSTLAGELRAIGFFSIKTGGCHDVAKNGLDRLERIVERAAALFCVASHSPIIGEVAAENCNSTYTATHDSDLAAQISRLTQLDVLAQTSSQYARPSPRRMPDILKIVP